MTGAALTHDLVVAGAGPVGLAVAIEAASAGLSVVVLDPRDGPRDKACGEGLMPPARAALDRLGVEVDGRPFTGIQYLATGSARSAVARFRHGPGLGVRRTALSWALQARADELGVQIVRTAAEPPRLEPGVAPVVACGAWRSRWMVAAAGRHSPTRRALGVPTRQPAAARRRYGLRRHYRVPPWSDLVQVYWAEHAEAYVTPVADKLVGVAVLGPPGRLPGALLGGFPELAERLAGAEPVDDVRGAGPLRCRVTTRVVGPGGPSGQVLLAGDAAGYVDALTGEGIAIGLACAHELVAALVAGRPHDYEAAWWRATRRYRLLTGGLLAVAQRPVLRRAVVPAAVRLPRVFGAVVDQLG